MATTYQDTNVNQLVINKCTKSEFDAMSTHSETELFLVEEQIDDTPTENSTNPVSSGGVFTALQSCTQTAPLGAILPFAGSTIPTNWMLCDGSAISRTTYAELFALIGTAYGSGDGSTTFNIPDLRETVPVGAGTSTRAAISDHDSYSVGEFKDDQLQDHYHQNIYTKVGGVQYELTYFSRDTEAGASAGSTTNGDKKLYTGGVATLYRSGTTTHGKQLGVNYIIRVLGGSSEQPEQPINYNNIPINFSDESGTYSDTPQSSDNLQSGWTLAAMFARVKKWFASLKKVAFSGSWNDLSNTLQLKSNSGYVHQNAGTIYIFIPKAGINFYTEGMILVSNYGESDAMCFLRIRHGDSWNVSIVSLYGTDPIGAWVDTSLSTNDTLCVGIGSTVSSGNNKICFNPLGGLRISSIVTNN